MKHAPASRRSVTSAAIVPTLVTMAGLSALCVLTLYASDPAGWNDPAWWSNRHAVAQTVVVTNNSVVTTNYAPNNYAVANQGQLKYFTARAVAELNADLTNAGGAGTTLNTMVSNWAQDYLTNGYATNTANPTRPYKPSDLQAVNVGQLKYIASLIYGQLANAGYSGLYPSWIAQNTATDNTAANLGQLKQVFNFNFGMAGPTNLTASSNTNGTINLSWALPANNQATQYSIEQQNVDGSWKVIATLTNSAATSYAVTNLNTGEAPEFQIIAQNGSRVSLAQTTPADPGLVAPSNVNGTAGAAAGEIDLSWQNNSSDATYVIVNQSPDGVNWTPIAQLPATATSYAVTNLTVGQAYYFGVSAGNN